MSFYEEMRSLAADLGATFFLPATITSTTSATRTKEDRAAGRASTGTTSTRSARGVFGRATIKTQDGTLVTKITATLDSPVSVNETITIGNRTATVESVSEVNPDGGQAITYKAVMR